MAETIRSSEGGNLEEDVHLRFTTGGHLQQPVTFDLGELVVSIDGNAPSISDSHVSNVEPDRAVARRDVNSKLQPGPVRTGKAVMQASALDRSRLRGPGLLASSIAGLSQAAPGRFVVGVGSSSNVIVEGWNGIPFEKPYQRVRDTVKFLRKALTGESILGFVWGYKP